MNDMMRTKNNPKKTAETCGFNHLSLPIVKEFKAILKYGEALWDRLIFLTCFYSARRSHERFLPIFNASPDATRSRNIPSEGVKKAFALFLGNIL